MTKLQELLADRLGSPPRRGALAEAHRQTGIPHQVLRTWVEPGSTVRPDPPNLKKLAPYLEVPFKELLVLVWDDDAPHPRPLSPHERATRLLDELRATLAAIASGSQPNNDPKGQRSLGRDNVDYVQHPTYAATERRGGLLKFPWTGERRRAVMVR